MHGIIIKFAKMTYSTALCNVPPIKYEHFVEALRRIRPSVSQDSLKQYVDWTAKFGDISRS